MLYIPNQGCPVNPSEAWVSAPQDEEDSRSITAAEDGMHVRAAALHSVALAPETQACMTTLHQHRRELEGLGTSFEWSALRG